MGTFQPSEGSKELTATYFTLGCKLNFSETSTIASHLRKCGIREAASGEEPDICVVNTCSVTETADKKARSLIRRIVREHPAAYVIVTGCYAQLKPEEVASIEGVDLVLGSGEKLNLPSYLSGFGKQNGARIEAAALSRSAEFSPSVSRGNRTRYFLKVQDGCDYFCTYCTIPFARGRSRSGTIASLMEQARGVAAEGGKEIVITGVNIGDFGRNTGESFEDLLKALDAVEGIERFRISSIEPNLLTDSIIEWVASESRAFMPHFHIPLQSGSDAVLRMMNRRYDTALFASKIAAVREAIPDAFIGVDIIAGARGETPQEWERTLDFVASLPISRLHVFPYSERPRTAALHLAGVVSGEERAQRTRRLIEVSNSKLKEFMETNIGMLRPVLWEHRIKNTDRMTGLTDNYLRVSASYIPGATNTISKVWIDDIESLSQETMTASHPLNPS